MHESQIRQLAVIRDLAKEPGANFLSLKITIEATLAELNRNVLNPDVRHTVPYLKRRLITALDVDESAELTKWIAKQDSADLGAVHFALADVPSNSVRRLVGRAFTGGA